MRVLLDESIPADLAIDLAVHDVDTVTAIGWAGTSNGELLRRASGRYDVFVTMDSNPEYQQNVSRLLFGVVVLHAQSNRLVDLRPLVSAILDALGDLNGGEVRHVGA